MRPKLVLVIVLVTCNVSFGQGLVRWLNLNNQFVVESLDDRAVSLSGIDIKSSAGLLVPGDSPEPFLFDLSSTPQQVTFGTLGVGARIEGSTTLDVGYELESALTMGLDPCEDVSVGLPGTTVASCPIPGDADFNGTVDFADFLVVSNNFGQTETAWPRGDFDWDRKTTFADFLLLSANYGITSVGPLTQDEPISVRPSTSEEIAFTTGDFESPPLSAFDGAPDHWIHDGLLWSRKATSDLESMEVFENDAVTIVAPNIDNGRAIQFGMEMRRDGNTFELVSVRLQSSIQNLSFQLPDDFAKSLVLPVGTLESGAYEVGITRFELVVDETFTDVLDIDLFLADPANFELPDGPLVSISTGKLDFRVGASGVASVPEPSTPLSWIVGVLAFCTLGRRQAKIS